MQCLYRNRDDLLSLQPTKTSAEQSGQPQRRQEQEKDEPWCKCDRNCDDSNFFVQDLVSGQQSNNNNNFNFIIMLRSKKGTLRFMYKNHNVCVRFADFLSQRSRNWFLGANLQYGINNYPKMQLRRNVLFRFEDLLGEHGIWDIIEKRFLTRLLPVGGSLQRISAARLASSSAAVYWVSPNLYTFSLGDLSNCSSLPSECIQLEGAPSQLL